VAFKGRDPVTSKTVIDNKITEKVNYSYCSRNLISYAKEVDIDSKPNNCFKITDLINNTFRPEKTLKKQEYKNVQNTDRPFLLCYTVLKIEPLTLNLLTTTIVAPPSNASKLQTGFNSAFKGLKQEMQEE
jgi:hypothetical protein